MLSQGWEALFHLKILVELFHILLCFKHCYPYSISIDNFEETFKIKEYSSPGYSIDLWSSNSWRKNKFWQNFFFFLDFYDSPRETSIGWEHILLTLITNTTRQSFTTQTPSTWNFTQASKMLLLAKRGWTEFGVLEIMIVDWVTKGCWKLDMVSFLVNQSIAKRYCDLNNFSVQ